MRILRARLLAAGAGGRPTQEASDARRSQVRTVDRSRADPHLQLPGEPHLRPPRRLQGLQPRPGARRRPRRASSRPASTPTPRAHAGSRDGAVSRGPPGTADALADATAAGRGRGAARRAPTPRSSPRTCSASPRGQLRAARPSTTPTSTPLRGAASPGARPASRCSTSPGGPLPLPRARGRARRVRAAAGDRGRRRLGHRRRCAPTSRSRSSSTCAPAPARSRWRSPTRSRASRCTRSSSTRTRSPGPSATSTRAPSGRGRSRCTTATPADARLPGRSTARSTWSSSNPPYIPDDASTARPEVRDHDPPLALCGGARRARRDRAGSSAPAAPAAAPGGVVVVEHADAQGESVPGSSPRHGGWAATSPTTRTSPAATALRTAPTRTDGVAGSRPVRTTRRLRARRQRRIATVSRRYDSTDPTERDRGLDGGRRAPSAAATSSSCRPTPSTASAPTPSRPTAVAACWRPRAAAATCPCRCWSARRDTLDGLVDGLSETAAGPGRRVLARRADARRPAPAALPWDLGDTRARSRSACRCTRSPSSC